MPVIEELQEDNYPEWAEHSIDICKSIRRPSTTSPWKLVIKVKSSVDGLARIDDFGMCSFHQTSRTNSESPCQKVFLKEETYEKV